MKNTTTVQASTIEMLVTKWFIQNRKDRGIEVTVTRVTLAEDGQIGRGGPVVACIEYEEK